MDWWLTVWEISLTLAVILSTAVTVFIITLPSSYEHFHPQEITEATFTHEDKENAARSGYGFYQMNKDAHGILKADASVQVVVLGDMGRSPRMQYHALSIAAHGGKVRLVGYMESDLHPDVQAHRCIEIVPITPFPQRWQTNNKLLFLLLAPWKVLWQVSSLYYALAYRTEASHWMLVQNPPSIPTLIVARTICFFRNTRLIIDWHNFGYSILALRLGPGHPLVKLSEWYEGLVSRGATAHLCVTNAMVRVLQQKWNIEALPLHDRPPAHFQPLTPQQRADFLLRLPQLVERTVDYDPGRHRLVVSSTSWTPDEDFSVLLSALTTYSAAASKNSRLPKLWAIITGKGPQKAYYMSLIRALQQERKLANVTITTAWLSMEDYALLLGSSDLGISLHTSSSGVDLPMKVVDMFGTGLPVAGWEAFAAWTELVKEGENGRGFGSADKLAEILQDLFGGDERRLDGLRRGALRECERRWEDEWMPVAGQLFKLK
nr:chitobiosyldiphosphodolichol beta-mannosyltransferase [Quercus suber]